MPTVAILGGGYGGIRTALTLHRLLDRHWNIVLLDRGACHQLITRLPEVIAGVIPSDRSAIRLARILPSRIRLVRCEVEGIDVEQRRVDTSRGNLRADYIVLALGTGPDYGRVPGTRQHSWPVKSLDDAVRIHARLRELFLGQASARVVIVGGGYTATEVAGEIAEWNRRLDGRARRSRFTVTIVNDEAQLLHGDNAPLAAAVLNVLRGKGVVVYTGTPVQRIEPGTVILPGDKRMDADMIIWAAGSRVQLPASRNGMFTGQEGRVNVDQYLRAYPGVYVVGDAALAHDPTTGEVVPASAQLAVQAGELAARNMAAEVGTRRLREFRPHNLGEALDLGGSDGAAEIAGLVVTGHAALGVKKAALVRYLRTIGGLQLAARYL